MIEIPPTPHPKLALLGYVHDLPLRVRHYTALELLLAKRRIAICWEGRSIPNKKDWIQDMITYHTRVSDYADLIPIISRPMNIWAPLISYLQGRIKVDATADAVPASE